MPTQTHLFESASTQDAEPRPVCPGRVAEITQVLQKRGWAFLKVSGKSMFPWIRESDIVFLRRARILDIVRGDVVVFERNGALCVHRVLAIRGNATQMESSLSLITKGDATADADSPVSLSDLLGKVEFVYRRNREIQIAAGWRKHFGKVLAFLSPAVAWFRELSFRSSSDSEQCESLPARMDAPHSSENSAD